MTTGALDGLRVLDLSNQLSGPYCAMLLGDLGADVIKVEHPVGGDNARQGAPHINGESAPFMTVNRNKRSITVDLKAPDGLAIVRRLAARADVVLENWRPGTAARLGLGYDADRLVRLRGCRVLRDRRGPKAPRPGPPHQRPVSGLPHRRRLDQSRRWLTAALAGHLRGARRRATHRRSALWDAHAACPAQEGARGVAAAALPERADLGLAREARGGRRSRGADLELRPGLHRPARQGARDGGRGGPRAGGPDTRAGHPVQALADARGGAPAGTDARPAHRRDPRRAWLRHGGDRRPPRPQDRLVNSGGAGGGWGIRSRRATCGTATPG